jgi:tetratricopeptide (TPR) repeat protein
MQEIPNKKLSIILFGLLLSPLVSASEGELAKEQAYSLFVEANDFFKQANSAAGDPERARRLYEKAILNYEKIINDGRIKNPMLYYNLGNAYFLKGNPGEAILNYRRAEKIGPDREIEKNLDFARSKRVDILEPKAEKRVLQTLFFWHYDFSLKTRFFLTCLFFAVGCISLTVIVWLGRMAPTTAIAAIFGVLTACFLISVALETYHQTTTVCGVITANEVVAHQADWQNSPPSFKEPLHEGTEFDLIEQRPGWLHIELSDGSDGWIPDNAAGLI